MKAILSGLILLVALQSSATVRTLNSNNPSPGQFTTMASAVAASSNNDTIYVSGLVGTFSNYGSFSLTKPLTIIGTGHNPSKQNPLVSTFTFIDVGSLASGTRFIGLNFTNTSFINGNCTYQNCKLTSLVSNTALVSVNMTNCIILSNLSSFVLSTYSLQNCFISGRISATSPGLITGNAVNCIFMSSSTSNSCAQNLNGFLFQNCIFYGISPVVANTANAVQFQYCLSFLCPDNNFTPVSATNFVNVNPQFTTLTTQAFNYTNNYMLLPGSPAENAGSDGNDLGLYGGPDGAFFRIGGEPAIPQIIQMNVTNTTVPAGTPLNVNIISTRKVK